MDKKKKTLLDFIMLSIAREKIKLYPHVADTAFILLKIFSLKSFSVCFIPAS